MEEDRVRVITRYGEPSKLDTADFKALCRVIDETKDYCFHQFYIQLSRDSESPKWRLIGSLNNEEILLKLIDLLN